METEAQLARKLVLVTDNASFATGAPGRVSAFTVEELTERSRNGSLGRSISQDERARLRREDHS